MQIQAVLFDLDGTLADTALDLGGALNALLREKGLPEKSMAQIRPHASHGSGALVTLGTGLTAEHPEFQSYRQAYLAQYEQCFDKETVLFDGVHDLLTQLHERGIKWGIVTNKPETFTHRLLPKLGFRQPVSVVVSGDTCDEAKPSTKPMLFACEKLGIAPEHCLYVGDAERDMLAGRNAGMVTVLAEWGYIADDDDTESWLYDYTVRQVIDVLDIIDIVERQND